MDLDDLLKDMIRGKYSKKKKKKVDFEDRLAQGVVMALGVAGAYAFGRSQANQSVAPAPPNTAPASPLPPPPNSSSSQQSQSAPPSAPVRDHRSLVVVRAMIAAANADHHIDDEERRRILSKAEHLGLSDEERRFLHHEFDRPATIQVLAREIAGDVALSRQVYLVSLLVVDLDTDAEKFYLERLAESLAIPASEIRELHEQAAM